MYSLLSLFLVQYETEARITSLRVRLFGIAVNASLHKIKTGLTIPGPHTNARRGAFSPFLSPPSSPFPLEVGPLWSLRELCIPSGVWGRAL